MRSPLLVISLLLLAGPHVIRAEEPASPRLEALRKKIAAGGAPAALERFWRRVAEEGTPLVEPVEGTADEVLVTFLWRGEKTRNVLVVTGPAQPIW